MIDHASVLAFVSASWPSPQWSPEGQALFIQAISDCDAADMLAAAQHFYANTDSGFRPTPGQLKVLLRGDTTGDADRAWGAFLKAVAHYAGRPSQETVDMPLFADPRCTETVEAIGGFRQFLGGIEIKENDWLRSRFIKAYKYGAEPKLELSGRRNPLLDGRGPSFELRP